MIRGIFPLWIMACIIPCYAQEGMEYGSPKELVGVQSYFVYTDMNLEKRNKIVKRISEELPNLILSDDAESADVILLYDYSISSFIASSSTSVSAYSNRAQITTTHAHRNVIYGEGYIIKSLEKNGARKVRILADFKDSKATRFERDPATNFARSFIKHYKDEHRKISPVYIITGEKMGALSQQNM